GSGGKRDNSFLTHQAKGSFCYGFFPHGSHPAGNGLKYRATAEGPGVAPDGMWQGNAPGPYGNTADAPAGAQRRPRGEPSRKPKGTAETLRKARDGGRPGFRRLVRSAS